jgi:hypothetical protein
LDAADAPVPLRLMTRLGFVAVLAMLTLPLTNPVAAGAKVTLSVAVLPPLMISPEETLFELPGLNPAPVTLTPVMVMLEVPELVRVALSVLLLPVLTVLKFNSELLELSVEEPAADTVNVIGIDSGEFITWEALTNTWPLWVPAAKPLGLAPTCTVFVVVPVVPEEALRVIQD